MFFRITAAVVALIAFTIILDEIWGLKHTQQQQIYELQRRVYDLENHFPPAGKNYCPSEGAIQPWENSYDQELDAKRRLPGA